MVLSTKKIAHAKPGKTRREIPHGEVRGLYLQIHPSGKQSWAFRYRIGSRSRKLTIGKSPEIGLADARNLARKAYLSVANGIDPAEEKKLARISARTPPDLDKVETVAATFIKRHVASLAPGNPARSQPDHVERNHPCVARPALVVDHEARNSQPA